MRNILITMIVSIVAMSLLFTDAEARRFGGGKSFGFSRQQSTFSKQNSGLHNNQAQNTPKSNTNKWLGPLAGLAVGGLLASLLANHGLGSSILIWLLIGGLILFAWRLFASKFQRHSVPAINAYRTAEHLAAPSSTVSTIATNTNNQIDIVRQSKALFIRMQTAYDSKNLTDLREFTAPEVFAEIQLQLQEQHGETNQTEVISLDAELLDISTENQRTTASVCFTGLVREELHAEPIHIKEIWHLRQDIFKKDWIVAGIQQTTH